MAAPWMCQKHEDFVQTISADDEVFETQIIRWEQRPTSEKSYLYLLNSSGGLVH